MAIQASLEGDSSTAWATERNIPWPRLDQLMTAEGRDVLFRALLDARWLEDDFVSRFMVHAAAVRSLREDKPKATFRWLIYHRAWMEIKDEDVTRAEREMQTLKR
jgi:hypothetical protein